MIEMRFDEEVGQAPCRIGWGRMIRRETREGDHGDVDGA